MTFVQAETIAELSKISFAQITKYMSNMNFLKVNTTSSTLKESFVIKHFLNQDMGYCGLHTHSAFTGDTTCNETLLNFANYHQKKKEWQIAPLPFTSFC